MDRRNFLKTGALALTAAALSPIEKIAASVPQDDKFSKTFKNGKILAYEGNIILYEGTYTYRDGQEFWFEQPLHVKYYVTDKTDGSEANVLEVYKVSHDKNDDGSVDAQALTNNPPLQKMETYYDIPTKDRPKKDDLGALEEKIEETQRELIIRSKGGAFDTNEKLLKELSTLYKEKTEFVESHTELSGSSIERMNIIQDFYRGGNPKRSVTYAKDVGALVRNFKKDKAFDESGRYSISWDDAIADSNMIAQTSGMATYKNWLIRYNDIMEKVVTQIPEFMNRTLGPPENDGSKLRNRLMRPDESDLRKPEGGNNFLKYK